MVKILPRFVSLLVTALMALKPFDLNLLPTQINLVE